MPRPASLGDMIEAIDRAGGATRLAVPGDQPLEPARLVANPRPFDAVIEGDAARTHITPALRTLARMRDPVAEAHAGWLLAVLLASAGITPTHDAALPPSTDASLTPEGRAWLVQQAFECVATDAQRAMILGAVRA